MLEQHPAIATAPRELTLFSRYLAPAYASFRKEKGHMDRGDWQQGLPLLLSEAEFIDGLRAITASVYQRVLRTKPGASLILDKHPGYTYHLPLIEQLVPGGRFIHLLRDGRETAISMLSARAKMGFGAGTMEDAAREWAESVRLARLHGARVGEARFMEIRYEDFVRNAVRNTTQSIEIRNAKPCNQLCMIYQQIGIAITKDNSTNRIKSLLNKINILAAEAPITFLTPISLLRCCTLYADNPNRPKQAMIMPSKAKIPNTLPKRMSPLY